MDVWGKNPYLACFSFLIAKVNPTNCSHTEQNFKGTSSDIRNKTKIRIKRIEKKKAGLSPA